MTNRLCFTKRALDQLPLPCPGQRAAYHDTKAPALQLRITHLGVKTFSVYRRVKRGAPERVTLGRYPAMSIEQARRRAAEINAAIENLQNPGELRRALRGEPTFADVFTAYIQRHSKPRKRTWREDQRKYEQYLEVPLGRHRAREITRAQVAAVHDRVTAAGHPTTANRILALISSLFGWAIDAGLLDSNPASGIRRNPEHPRERFLRGDELPRFFASLRAEANGTMRDFFLLSLLTGGRRENVLEMRWSDVSLAEAVWRIPRTKNGSGQVVQLPSPAVALLAAREQSATGPFVLEGRDGRGHITETRRAWQRIFDRDELWQLSERLRAAGQNFTSTASETLPCTLARARREADLHGVSRVGARLDPLRPHDLRRTLGSWQAMQGASLVIIGKSLNHKSLQSTMVYARLDQDPVRQSVERAVSAMMHAAGAALTQKSAEDEFAFKGREQRVA